MWITDLKHFLDEKGFIADMPNAAKNRAFFMGSVAAWVTSHAPTEMLHTNIHCQRSPGRKRCPGVIRASFDSNALAIYWHCPICEDNGYIRGWENTLWDRRDPDFK